jgi:predicted RNA binding protein YcfA (HicA-like mRNA interferase family)
MGNLPGFNYDEVASRLKAFGFTFVRNAKGSHEIWRNSDTGMIITVPHHPGDFH